MSLRLATLPVLAVIAAMERPSDECRVCGGSGGGYPPNHCQVCGGSGEQRRPRPEPPEPEPDD